MNGPENLQVSILRPVRKLDRLARIEAMPLNVIWPSSFTGIQIRLKASFVRLIGTVFEQARPDAESLIVLMHAEEFKHLRTLASRSITM